MKQLYHYLTGDVGVNWLMDRNSPTQDPTTSYDGVSWNNAQNPLIDIQTNKIVWDDMLKRWVLVGKTVTHHPIVATSSDGLSWTIKYYDTNSWKNPIDIIYDDITGRWVMYGYIDDSNGNESGTFIMTSINLVDWTFENVSYLFSLISKLLLYTQRINGVITRKYMLVGTHANQLAFSAISSDLINWSLVPVTSIKNVGNVNKGAWDASTNTPYLSATGPTGVVDGWYYPVSVGGTQNLGYGAITFSAGNYVSFCNGRWVKVNSYYDLTGLSEDYLLITDLVVDESAPIENIPPPFKSASIDSPRIVAVGIAHEDTGEYHPCLLYYQDGVWLIKGDFVWRFSSGPNRPNKILYNKEKDIWLLGGVNWITSSIDYDNSLFYSYDTNTWTPVNYGLAFSSINPDNTFYYNGKIFIVVGTSPGPLTTYMYSNDGIYWFKFDFQQTVKQVVSKKYELPPPD